MAATLSYGRGSVVELKLDPRLVVADCAAPRGNAIADVPGAVKAALTKPIDFPPLEQAVIPGDRIVLAIEPSVPQAGAIVGAVVAMLLQSGATAENIAIVQSVDAASAAAAAQTADLREHLPAECRDEIEIVDHDPTQRDLLSYLGADERGEPVYVNRRLFDADVVLPIGCLRLNSAWDYYGINGTVCPTFSDAATIDRFRATAVDPEVKETNRRRREADEVARLLGVLLTIQVVPGPDGAISHVLAGTTRAVERQGAELCEAAWNFETPRRAELVVAAIAGGADQQTWENVGRALAAASRAVTEDGAIALCTELSDRPGPALQLITGAHDLHEAMEHIRRLRTPDAPAAHEVARALQRCRVYLLSRLDESAVEDLGMAPVSSAEEVARLARRHSSCIVLGSAQFAQATAAGDVDEPVGQRD